MAIADQPVERQDAQKKPSELFRYSEWVHVGIDADECEDRESGCQNPEHFHAWCRLPNQMQHEDIRERALAAKARRIRLLRDPESDAYQVLEAEIDELRRGERSELVDEIVGKDWWKRQLDAIKDLAEDENYKTIDRDRERVRELRAMDSPPQDELDELERHLSRYTDALVKRREELEQPIRDSTEALTETELVEQIREDRISAEGSNAFMESYNRWQWLSGTFTTRGLQGKPSFTGMPDLHVAAAEILEALQQTFSDLEGAMQRGPAGNS